MKAHLAYLKNLLIHKYWVFVAGRMLGVSLRQLVIHDWSKFTPAEWRPYVRNFYNPDGTKRRGVETQEFQLAWLHHLHWNPHHHQHWVLQNDSGEINELPMPEKYVSEMVADWAGAGRAYGGSWYAENGELELRSWLAKSRQKMRLHPDTASRMLHLVSVLELGLNKRYLKNGKSG
jgi:hypothetical protein